MARLNPILTGREVDGYTEVYECVPIDGVLVDANIKTRGQIVGVRRPDFPYLFKPHGARWEIFCPVFSMGYGFIQSACLMDENDDNI